MGVRRQSREWALQFLFQRDYNTGDLPEALEMFWTGKKPSTRARSFMEELVHGVEREGVALDELIQKYAEHWDIRRMGGVDRNVMRIALYEMLHMPDVPPVVSIDEAVEIAKMYSSNESGKFVNGILDRALRDLRRPTVPPTPKRIPKES